MSLREEVLKALEGYDVRKVEIDREHAEHGVPSIKVDVTIKQSNGTFRHTTTFAKGNNMSSEQIAGVVRSYIKEK